MLKIRPAQLKVFEETASRRFEDEMVAHGRDFSPRLSAVLGEEQLRVAVRESIGRAFAHGFTNRGPARLCVELMFLRGSDFDTDPQYPGLGDCLRARGDQMMRAERMHAMVVEYQQEVSGPGGVNTRRALEEVLATARREVTITQGGFVAGMLRELGRIFPQKAAWIGEPALVALVRRGVEESRRHHLAGARADALIVALMFAFGHGCAADPLYPWIERTLKDDRIVDPAGRAARLERKAVTWLGHVLGVARDGGTAT